MSTQRSDSMGPNSHDSAGSVCIVLPERGTDYDEAGSILARIVQESGRPACMLRDGAPSILDADTLILFGKCSAFTQSARLLGAHPARRPVTILWHIEPLLPGVLPDRAMATARRLARCDWSLLPAPLASVVKYVPAHNLLRDAARSALSAKLKRLAAWEAESACAEVHPRQWHHAAQHYMWLGQWHSRNWCDLVAASTIPRCNVLMQMGICWEYAPMGYHPAWGEDLGIERDIEVLFLGRVKRTSRQPILHRLGRRLQDKGVRLVLVERGCYGPDRTRLLSRTRIALDIAQHAWEMPLLRLLISMACGAMVVSNWRSDPHPLHAEHLVRADLDALVDTILYYLNHESERRAIAESARCFVTSELTWNPVVWHVLQRGREQFEARSGVIT
mgnify:CR=1 FL=1